jgi:hypothetical protein
MKTLLIINDNSSEARHAAEFALLIAQKMQANIMLVNTSVVTRKIAEKVPAGYIPKTGAEEQTGSGTLRHLIALNEEQASFKPEIKELDISGMNENEVIELVNRNYVWMMIKGMSDPIAGTNTKKSLNIHAVLNKVLCPLLLVPLHWQIKDIERLAYIADLRYCRVQVVRFLAILARPWQAALSIAHRSANGLPDMAEKYALTVFSEEVSQNVNYDNLFFNNIREKDLSKVVDVIINTMHNDILVMVNHRFHFEEIVGRYITDTLPPQITVPLLIFPC